MRRLSPKVFAFSATWLLFVAWIVYGYLAVRNVEQPAYTVLQRSEGYEVRAYPAYMAAQVSVKQGWSEALATGSRALSEYLFGDNVSQESISLNRPVGIQEEPESELIAMTAPVLTQEKGDAFLVSYILPAGYTSATIPRPNNPEIRVVEVPSSVVAARMFGGRVDRERALQEESVLRELLARDKHVTLSAARVAQYSPRWTPPFLRRSEVLIPIRQER